MKGKIVKYFSYRGYGFISTESTTNDIFFHISNYPFYNTPKIGVELEFELLETPKGKEAINVKIIDEASKSNADEVKVSKTPSSAVIDIKGVGQVTEKKLKAAGYSTVESIASDDAETVSNKTDISEKVAEKIIASAKELLN